MIGDLIARFVLGGAIVSAFAALGEIVRPKTLSGVFAAAPSVAIATLAIGFAKDGPVEIASEARAMLGASAAMLVYAVACVVATKRARFPVWLATTAAWLAWAIVAFGAWLAVRSLA